MRSRYVAPLIVLLLFGQFLWFTSRRLSKPSDGTRFVPLATAGASDGLPFASLIDDPAGVRTGDIVTAVEGISLGDWMSNALNPNFPRPEQRADAVLAYTVRRGSATLTVHQALADLPPGVVNPFTWSDVTNVAFLGLALFLFAKKRDEPVAAVLLIVAAAQLTTNWEWGVQAIDVVAGPPLVHYFLSTGFVFMLIWTGYLHFALVFPRPLLSARANRYVLPLVYALPYPVIALWWILTWRSKTSVPQWYQASQQPFFAQIAVYALLTLIAVLVSLRTARDPIARAQIRWVVWAVIGAFLVTVILGLVPRIAADRFLFDPNTSLALINMAFLLIPVAIVISVLRYRLFDIDVVIRRTTTYAVITVLLLLIYFGSVVVFQSAFSRVTGEDSTAAVVLSTLLIAVLFNPIRRRVQDAIDRRFNRTHYDAEKTLEAFAATVRNETDLDALTAELVRVIQETMQPESISVWLKPVARTPRSDE